MKIFALVILVITFVACDKGGGNSAQNFIYKKSENGVVLNFEGKEVKSDEIFADIKGDIFSKEMEIYEMKMAKVKAHLLKVVMEADPRKKGLTNDQFLEKYLAKDLKVNKAEIDAFIKERKIPQAQVNPETEKRIKAYLLVNKKKEALEKYVAKKTKKNPPMISIEKPERPKFNIVVTDKDPKWGGKDAKVTLVEYSDFQCPFCAKGADRLKELKEKYGKKIQIVFKHFPLPFHNHAKEAAVASMCAQELAGDKGFWKIHDWMFGNQDKLSEESLVKNSKSLGLNSEKFATCLKERRYSAKVESDMASGKSVFVKSTPTFFINGHLINGAQPIEVFEEVINRYL